MVKHRSGVPARGWVIWFLAAGFFFYEFCIQVSPSVMVNDLMREFSVNAETIGKLIGSYLVAYGCMQLVVGILIDRYGPRKLITMAALLCMLGCLLFGTAIHIEMARVGRMLIGIGSAFALISCFKLTANWFPTDRFALMTGLVVTIGMLGAINGQGPFSSAVAAFGWREVMNGFALIGAVLSVMMWLVVRDHPATPLQHHANHVADPELPILKGLRVVFTSPQTWLVSIYGALMYAPTPAFAGLWGAEFIAHNYGFDKTKSAEFISLIYVGWAIGSPLFGWISDYYRKRKLPLVIGAVGALVVSLLLLHIKHMFPGFLGLLLFAFGMFSAAFLPAFSLVREINPNNISATAIGFTNMLNSLGGALLQPLVGRALDHFARGSQSMSQLAEQSQQAALVYNGEHYRLALQLISICFLVALLLLPFIKETHCKVKKDLR